VKRFLVLCLVFCALLVVSCTAETRSLQALTSQGITNVQFGGYGWLDCADSDTFATKFTGTNANGQHVSGTVCCGFIKNCTIRW
jgi:hypothetical protein